MRRNWVRIGITGLVLVGVGLLVQRAGVQWEQVKDTLYRFSWQTLAAAFFFNLGQIVLLLVRVWVLFPKKGNPGFLKTAHVLAVGQWVNLFIPARAGDAVKIAMLSRNNSTYPAFKVAGVLVADRILDIASLVGLFLFCGSFLLPVHLPHSKIPAWVWGSVILVTVSLMLFVGFQLADRLPKFKKAVMNFRHGLELAFKNPARGTSCFVVAAIAWICEAGAIGALCYGLGFPLAIQDMIFVIFILNAAIAIPVSVANVGPFEASIGYALGHFAIPLSSAIAVGVVHHLLQMITISLCAGLFTLLHRNSIALPSARFSRAR